MAYKPGYYQTTAEKNAESFRLENALRLLEIKHRQANVPQIIKATFSNRKFFDAFDRYVKLITAPDFQSNKATQTLVEKGLRRLLDELQTDFHEGKITEQAYRDVITFMKKSLAGILFGFNNYLYDQIGEILNPNLIELGETPIGLKGERIQILQQNPMIREFPKTNEIVPVSMPSPSPIPPSRRETKELSHLVHDAQELIKDFGEQHFFDLTFEEKINVLIKYTELLDELERFPLSNEGISIYQGLYSILQSIDEHNLNSNDSFTGFEEFYGQTIRRELVALVRELFRMEGRHPEEEEEEEGSGRRKPAKKRGGSHIATAFTGNSKPNQGGRKRKGGWKSLPSSIQLQPIPYNFRSTIPYNPDEAGEEDLPMNRNGDIPSSIQDYPHNIRIHNRINANPKKLDEHLDPTGQHLVRGGTHFATSFNDDTRDHYPVLPFKGPNREKKVTYKYPGPPLKKPKYAYDAHDSTKDEQENILKPYKPTFKFNRVHSNNVAIANEGVQRKGGKKRVGKGKEYGTAFSGLNSSVPEEELGDFYNIHDVQLSRQLGKFPFNYKKGGKRVTIENKPAITERDSREMKPDVYGKREDVKTFFGTTGAGKKKIIVDF